MPFLGEIAANVWPMHFEESAFVKEVVDNLLDFFWYHRFALKLS